jgi:hypothetical protein
VRPGKAYLISARKGGLNVQEDAIGVTVTVYLIVERRDDAR